MGRAKGLGFAWIVLVGCAAAIAVWPHARKMAALEARLVAGLIPEHSGYASPWSWHRHPLEFIFEVSRGSGYTQFAGMPMVCRTTYPLHLDDYKRREDTAWPKKKKHTVKPSKSPEEADAQARDRMREELGDLFAQAEA